MKIRSFLTILLAVILIPLTLASDTQRRFKVHVTVKENDSTDLDERLEAFVKRELRALGDVDIVGIDADWTWIVTYNILEIPFKDGRKSGSVAIASIANKNFGTFLLTDMGQSAVKLDKGHSTPVFWNYPGVAHWSVDNLHEYAIQDVANIDKVVFQP